jgi:PAS domain S-box-containing protein
MFFSLKHPRTRAALTLSVSICPTVRLLSLFSKTRKLFIVVIYVSLKWERGDRDMMIGNPKEKEEFYRILVENAMDALILCDEKLNFVYTSPSTERLFGYKKDELIGRSAFEFFHPEDISDHKARLEMLLEGKEFPSIEFRVRKKNGAYVWCDVATKAIQTPEGDNRIIVVTREVHERKKIEEALKVSEGRYRGITESMTDTIIEANRSGKITYINHLFPALTREQVLKSTIFDFVPPNQVSTVKDALERVYERGEATKYESHGPGPDGKSRVYEVNVSPIYAEDKVISAVFLARDISERKEMQEKLEEFGALCDMELNSTKKYLEQLISRLPLALVAWDKDCKIKTWNPKATQMFGFSESEFLKISPEDLFSQTQSPCPIKRIWTQLLKDGQAAFVGENISKDGKTMVCNWTNVLLRNDKGNPDGVLSMIQDVTEKRKLEERLRDIAYSLSGVKAGESYLVGSIHQSLKIAFDLTSQRVKGLFIVRENPDSLIKNYNFKPEEIVLLSAIPIKEFKAVNDLQDVAITITKFLKDGGGVVVMGGLEYLISRCGFNPVFMMIQEKRFEFLEAGATLLVPINLETLDSREKGLLTSELKLIE